MDADDVTAGRKSGQPQHQGEAFFRQVLDATTDYAIIALSCAGRVTLWNKGAEKLLGWTAKEMIGETLDRLLVDVASHEVFFREMEVARQSGLDSGEGWRLTKEGRHIWATGEMRLLHAGDGAVTGFVKVLRDRTAEYEASQAARRSQELLRRAQEAGHIGVFAIDAATGWLEPSEEACRLLGIDITEGLPASDIEALVLPEDRHIASDHARRMAGDIVGDVEYRVRRQNDGKIRTIARRAELERDVAGRAVRLVGVLQDVTEQRAMQQSLEASEAQARTDAERVQLALAAGAIIGTWVWDISADRFSVDEQFAVAFGMDPALGRDGIPLETIIATVHPEDKDGLIAAIDEVVGRGGTYAHQYRVMRADGRYYWIEANGRVERTPDGTLRFPGVLLDVQHRRSLEQDRDTAHRLLKTVMEAVPGVVYAKDRDGRMLMGNAGTAALLGLAPEIFLGRTDLDNLEDEDQARAVMANDRRIMDAGMAEQVVEDVHLADGTHAVWHSHKAPLRDEGGAVIGLVGASIDVTDRIKAEKDLRVFNETLEQRVANTIAERERAEEALRQAQKMEAIGQLTGGVAHDFNNLLSIIMGSVDMAIRALEKSGNDDARLHKSLGNAMVGANRAAALTQRLLAFSRRQPLAPRPVAVADLIDGMREIIAQALGEAITVKLDLAQNLWMVEIDANQLESALLNLSVNARDAMPAGGVLTISAANLVLGGSDPPPIAEMAPGAWVRIKVGDRGAGMSADIVSRVFEPFFTTKEQGKGTGLGLSMVYGFVRQSGGHVAIWSEPGVGTTVSLYLPRIEGVAQGSVAEPMKRSLAAPRGATILVVEDDEGVRAFTVDCLSEQGFVVVQAEDAFGALAILQQENLAIDLLLTDVVMPGPSGSELADRAKVIRPGLKVLFMSGYPRDAIVHDGKLDDGVELLTKPFTYDALAERLAHVLANWSQIRA